MHPYGVSVCIWWERQGAVCLIQKLWVIFRNQFIMSLCAHVPHVCVWENMWRSQDSPVESVLPQSLPPLCGFLGIKLRPAGL